MGGASSTSRGKNAHDDDFAMALPDESWVGEHLRITKHDEHGGVVVEVVTLAREGADADVDVAKTAAWLQAHGGGVKVFHVVWGSCGGVASSGVCGGCVFCAARVCAAVCAAVRDPLRVPLSLQRRRWVRACTRWHEAWEHARR